MFNPKTMTFFFVTGLAGSLFLKGVQAAPLDGVSTTEAAAIPTGSVDNSNDVVVDDGLDELWSDISNFHSKGIFVDPIYNEPFELLSEIEDMEPAAAYEEYLSTYNETAHIEKRGWYDCKFPNQNIKTLGCHTAHGLGKFVAATGASAMGGYVSTLMSEAFNGKRDNQNPRSVCLTRGKETLCTSWATYNTNRLRAGEANDIAYYSTQCAIKGGSSEFKTVMSDGGILYICVSDRASGCGQDVCGK